MSKTIQSLLPYSRVFNVFGDVCANRKNQLDASIIRYVELVTSLEQYSVIFFVTLGRFNNN